MEKFWLHGTFENTSFAQLLFRIWKSKRTGLLEIKGHKSNKKIDFSGGDVLSTNSSFPQEVFLKDLSNRGLLPPQTIIQCEKFASEKNMSIIKAIVEMDILSAPRLWNLMEDFHRAELMPIFDWDNNEFFFDSEHLKQEEDLFFSVQTLNIILQGIRQMENFKIITSLIPDDDEPLEIVYPDHINGLDLDATELYLLQIVKDRKNLSSIFELSELGERETQRRIFGFMALGILCSPKLKTPAQLHNELSQYDLYKILDAFNEKCTYIFKYISKEIGPVAMNVLKKALDDIRPHLPPSLRQIVIGSDGKIKTDSALKTNISLSSEEKRKETLRGLNEILTAELLAVKRTLGNDHESTLINNLQKVGEWS